MAENASRASKYEKWRDELKKSSTANQGTLKDPFATFDEMITSISCVNLKCDKVKLELRPDKVLHLENVQITPVDMNGSDVSEPASKKKKDNHLSGTTTPPEPLIQICPCTMMTNGQLVTYCCSLPDCDEASKISIEGREKCYNHFNF